MENAPTQSAIVDKIGIVSAAMNMWLQRLVKTVSKNEMQSLPVYANNAAALVGGLVAGQIYRTATGQVMVVY